MVTEDYVSFETAKLLKEKGFNEYCTHVYNIKTGRNLEADFYTSKHVYNSWLDKNEPRLIVAPTLQMAIKWLREVHNINPVPYALSLGWAFDIFDLSNRDITGCKKLYSMDFPSKSEVYNTYEQACEAAIKYCIENLI